MPLYRQYAGSKKTADVSPLMRPVAIQRCCIISIYSRLAEVNIAIFQRALIIFSILYISKSRMAVAQIISAWQAMYCQGGK